MRTETQQKLINRTTKIKTQNWFKHPGPGIPASRETAEKELGLHA